MHSWQDGNGLLSNINTGENGRSLRDTWETRVQDLWWQMAKLEINVILFWTNATTFTDF